MQHSKSYETVITGKDFREKFTLEVGDIITSRRELCEHWVMERRTVNKAIASLNELGLIEIIHDKYALLLRIVPAEGVVKSDGGVGFKTQGGESYNPGGVGFKTPNIEGVIKGEIEGVNTYRSDQNISKEVAVEKPSRELSVQKEATELAKQWLAFSTREMPWTAPPKSWSEMSFQKGIDKVMKSAGLNQQQMEAVFHYASNDDFWKSNIYSPEKLLTVSKSNGLRKIDTILSRMKGDYGKKHAVENRVANFLNKRAQGENTCQTKQIS